MKTTFKKVKGTLLIFLSFLAVLSCEKEFTDLGSGVVSNTKFDTNFEVMDIVIENSPITRIQSDNISRELGQYLLGIYNSSDYEKLEASVVSQLQVNSGFNLVQDTYGADTTVISTIDTAFIKLPFQVNVENNDGDINVELDSIIGDTSIPFNLNVYESGTYMNRLDPADPSKLNTFFSDLNYQKAGDILNAERDFQFLPSKNDTAVIIKRRLSDGNIHRTDTITYVVTANTGAPRPTAIIPLDEDKIKQLFLDKIGQPEFVSQDAFNDYFRGIILEATGNDGSLVSFNFNNTAPNNSPSIEIFFTNTVVAGGSTIVDTIPRVYSLPLSGIRANKFLMTERTYPNNNEIKIQGAAGSEGKITLFSPTRLAELRGRDWLVNDAELTLYINQAADTTNVPFRLYMYKEDDTAITPKLSQIEDAYTEANLGGIRGQLVRDDNGKKEKYVFKITDYVSELLNGNSNFNPTLKLKTFNGTDIPFSELDTMFNNYSWNPKAVTLFNHSAINSDKKARLKISYSTKKN